MNTMRDANRASSHLLTFRGHLRHGIGNLLVQLGRVN
jgi:hypothetical protein